MKKEIVIVALLLLAIDYFYLHIFFESDIEVAKKAAVNKNVEAFLKMIRYGEGTYEPVGYATMFTGKTFTDFSRHPNIRNCSGSLCSTAAGAYQFLYSTWQDLSKKLDLKDFSPASQDLAAIQLIKERKALQDVIDGRFEEAVRKCNTIWASLPGSPYGQPTVTMAKIKELYYENGGTFA